MKVHLKTIIIVSFVAALGSCQSSEKAATTTSNTSATKKIRPKGGKNPLSQPTLLLTQAQFTWETNAAGKRIPKPGPAKLLLLSKLGDGWLSNTLEDNDSRVFHKAVCQDKSILTIAGSDAHLKTWDWQAGQWQGKSHWHPKFGGAWDRLRDFEFGDVDGDQSKELIIATHDQGVVAVAEKEAGAWKAKEIYRQADTFIHEIEIGNLRDKGAVRIYSTPSKPNKADYSQSGAIMESFLDGDAYKNDIVVTLKDRHAKEILVADMNDDGVDELYASIEAHKVTKDGQKKIVAPLEIRRYKVKGNGQWEESLVARLEGGIQARVLTVGNPQEKGKKQMLVTTMRGGLYLLTPDKQLKKWNKVLIDKESSGFEHAGAFADTDGDGLDEIFVAADDQDRVSQYRWQDGAFVREDIFNLEKSDITWSIEFCP